MTGASRGIGRACAITLGSLGARVAVNYNKSASAADDVVARIKAGGGEATAVQGDVSHFATAQNVVKAAIASVTMETRKPPRGLAGAPWIEQQKIDLDAIKEETLIFEGPATEAVKAFPANVNVVAAVSLASIGPEKTRIKIYAVPGQERNQHRITVEGEFGRLSIEIENVPSENPRTGKLSYLSAIAMLRELGASVQVGN